MFFEEGMEGGLSTLGVRPFGTWLLTFSPTTVISSSFLRLRSRLGSGWGRLLTKGDPEEAEDGGRMGDIEGSLCL